MNLLEEASNHLVTNSGKLDDKYTLLNKLEKGQFSKVRVCVDTTTQTRYAVKLFNDMYLRAPKSNETISSEINALSKISHENIVKMIAYNLNGNVIKQCQILSTSNTSTLKTHGNSSVINSNNNKSVKYIIMELGERGALLELLLNKKAFPVKIARFFFKQMVNGLIYLHANNIAHRDIKLENFIVDRNFNIKFIDFGFACEIKDNKGELLTHTKVIGTEGYMAPEFFSERKYIANRTDIFALGVCLFCMMVGVPPFAKATKYDANYFHFFYKNQSGIKKFWMNLVEKGAGLTGDAIELLNLMLCVDGKERLDLETIKKSDFFNGETESTEEMYRFFINE
jgi:serine/threonine protein kinase